MSNQRDREKRKEERIAAESQAAERRSAHAGLLQLSAGGVWLAIIVVVVVIIVAGFGRQQLGRRPRAGRSTRSRSRKILDRDPAAELRPRQGEHADDADPCTRTTFRCPICKEYIEEVLPPIVAGQHQKGRKRARSTATSSSSARRVDPGRRSGPRGRRTGQRLDLHPALLPQPGRGELGLRDRKLHRTDRQSRRAFLTSPNGTRNAKAASSKRRSKRRPHRPASSASPARRRSRSKARSSNGLELLGTPGSTGAIEEAIEKAS